MIDEGEILDALENLYKMFDTPIVRRKLGDNELRQEALAYARKILEDLGRIGK